MSTPEALLAAALALCVSVAAGTIAHELSHALALRAAGHRSEIQLRPERRDGRHRLRKAWATVTPQIDASASPTAIRLAALAPLALATPLALVLAGLAPDPFRGGPLWTQAALIGWLGCALPSPRDFAVVWYAHRALATETDDEGPGVESA